MLDQLLTIYDLVIRFISEIHINEYLDVITGLLAIILLLLIARRIRKRRKLKSQAAAGEAKEMVHPDKEREVTIPPELSEKEYHSAVESHPEEPCVAPQVPEAGPEHDIEPETADLAEEGEKEETEASVELEEEEEEVRPLPEKAPGKTGFMDRLKSGLSKTRQSLSSRFDAILTANRKIDEEMLEEIEEVLITSDIGVPTTMELMQRIEKKRDTISTVDAFKAELKKEMLSLVNFGHYDEISQKPHVIMVVGVNGVGKTTTIGKLASIYTAQGKKVLLSASDTFRAAAVEQLEIWAGRSGADIVKHKDKSDPAAVAFDSVEASVARNIDIVIVDTAGRLHTKVNLMEELKKIKRSIGKKIPSAPHETFLVLDATTGQNAVSQAKLFNENIDITGIILTKLDGTAKGGIVLSICDTLNVPIRYIGIGEGIDDLQTFDPRLFIDALL